MGFWAALQFLTIFPTPCRDKVTAKATGQSLSYFPVIGLILGAVLLGLYHGLSFVLPSSVICAILIIALVILTGAHHLDGFIDTCDGLVVGRTREERLAIMSDSKVGAFGIVGVVVLLLLKYVSLSSAPVLQAFLLMPVISRWAMVSVIFAFPYAKRSGMGLAFKQGAIWQRLAVATAISLVITTALLKWWGLVMMTVIWLVIFGIASLFRSRLGGLTGDNYGAVNEIAEVLVLLLLVVIWRLD